MKFVLIKLIATHLAEQYLLQRLKYEISNGVKRWNILEIKVLRV